MDAERCVDHLSKCREMLVAYNMVRGKVDVDSIEGLALMSRSSYVRSDCLLCEDELYDEELIRDGLVKITELAYKAKDSLVGAIFFMAGRVRYEQ